MSTTHRGAEMTNVIVTSLDRPDESRTPSERTRIELASLGESTVGRATMQPGWRWSTDVKPHAGTDLCQVTHTGYVISGRSIVQMADGTQVELGPGDAFVVPGGHDAWVVGDEPYVTIDFSGTAPQIGQPEDRR
jgi:mannose-6-phosphate isomerase-like protein (cupin superfamily)